MKNDCLGVMLDCSRNAVFTVDFVKDYIDKLSLMGYNALMLYTEDTYEIPSEPFFGYMRGRYSVDELKEIVRYGEEKGIELIPCIQTLAHVNQIFRWPEYHKIRDIEDVMLIDDEGTYALIEEMFKVSREVFKSDRIHIGFDEAFRVGLGNYLFKHGYENRFEMLSRHLKRVCDLASKYGFRPMMWGDMFFRLANKGEYYIEDPSVITEEIAKTVPENCDIVYWDYYSTDVSRYDMMIKASKRFGGETWFAGGAWMWTGFTPHNEVSIRRTAAALEACRDNSVGNVLITCWGDDGAECAGMSVLPTLFAAAEMYRGNTDMDLIKEKFGKMFDISFDDFMKLDYPSIVVENYAALINPDKYMLYNDPFLGIYDGAVFESCSEAKYFAKHSKQLALLENHKEYGYMFKAARTLCDLMEIKYHLGKRTRAAYLSKDKSEIEKVIREFILCEELIDKFIVAFREAWLYEKKGHGFDVQDIRLGGVKQRLISCRTRLEQYVNGEIDHIDELDEPFLKRGNGPLMINKWSLCSPNVMSHQSNY